jgi:hypothetical protein
VLAWQPPGARLAAGEALYADLASLSQISSLRPTVGKTLVGFEVTQIWRILGSAGRTSPERTHAISLSFQGLLPNPS